MRMLRHSTPPSRANDPSGSTGLLVPLTGFRQSENPAPWKMIAEKPRRSRNPVLPTGEAWRENLPCSAIPARQPKQKKYFSR